MFQCEQCGAAFYSTTGSWGDRTCGECLANQIELSLMMHALGEQRKPMRRSSPGAAQDAVPPSLVEVPRRSA